MHTPESAAAGAVQAGAGGVAGAGADVATVPAGAPAAHREGGGQEAQGLTAPELHTHTHTHTHTLAFSEAASVPRRWRRWGLGVGLTVRYLEVEEVRAWDTAVTTLDRLFSMVTSDTPVDRL